MYASTFKKQTKQTAAAAKLWFMPFSLCVVSFINFSCMFLNLNNFFPIGILKLSRNKKDLNEVSAALFSVSFSQRPAAKKHQKWGISDIIKVLLIS